MKIPRPWMLIASVLLSAAMALVARDLVRDFLILPLAYFIWQLRGLLGSVAQLVQWGILVVILALVMAWQLVPDPKRRPRELSAAHRAVGPAETLALAILRARSSNYFKWQLAHRLGCLSRRSEELAGRNSDTAAPGPHIAGYLAAGLMHSFVDFPSRRHVLGRPTGTPLDVDPGEVVVFLESQSLMNGENHADSL